MREIEAAIYKQTAYKLAERLVLAIDHPFGEKCTTSSECTAVKDETVTSCEQCLVQYYFQQTLEDVLRSQFGGSNEQDN